MVQFSHQVSIVNDLIGQDFLREKVSKFLFASDYWQAQNARKVVGKYRLRYSNRWFFTTTTLIFCFNCSVETYLLEKGISIEKYSSLFLGRSFESAIAAKMQLIYSNLDIQVHIFQQLAACFILSSCHYSALYLWRI